MNSVSSAVGSKLLRTSLFPSPTRFAAVKPAPISSMKRAFGHRPGICRVKMVPRVAGMIHHDLDCHCVLL
jgi:hypothetical protein